MKRKKRKKSGFSAFLKLIFLSLLLLILIYAAKNLLSPYKVRRQAAAENENSPLYFGNPSAASKVSYDNYLLEKTTYALSYSESKGIPLWCAWHLCAKDLGNVKRSGAFEADSLPFDMKKVKPGDYNYKKYGFDRGHLCPSSDRTASEEANRETFLMTNMVPQSPSLNRTVWKNLESYSRSLVKNGKELYIVAGGAGEGGESEKGKFSFIRSESANITVPSFCYKIILVLDEGENDIARVNEKTPVICVLIPNGKNLEKDWSYYTLPVDSVEELTKFDFLSLLPDEIEDVIEADVYRK